LWPTIATKRPQPDDTTASLEIVGANGNHSHVVEMIRLKATDNNGGFLIRSNFSHYTELVL